MHAALLGGASADAVGVALANAFSEIDLEFSGLLLRGQLDAFLVLFVEEVAAAAAAGSVMVPPVVRLTRITAANRILVASSRRCLVTILEIQPINPSTLRYHP
jgi:hypothetical protein